MARHPRQDLSSDEAAEILSKVLDKPVRYQQVSLDDLASQMQARGASPAFIDGMVATMAAKGDGMDNLVPRTPETSAPTRFRDWAESVLKPGRARLSAGWAPPQGAQISHLRRRSGR